MLSARSASQDYTLKFTFTSHVEQSWQPDSTQPSHWLSSPSHRLVGPIREQNRRYYLIWASDRAEQRGSFIWAGCSRQQGVRKTLSWLPGTILEMSLMRRRWLMNYPNNLGCQWRSLDKPPPLHNQNNIMATTIAIIVTSTMWEKLGCFLSWQYSYGARDRIMSSMCVTQGDIHGDYSLMWSTLQREAAGAMTALTVALLNPHFTKYVHYFHRSCYWYRVR